MRGAGSGRERGEREGEGRRGKGERGGVSELYDSPALMLMLKRLSVRSGVEGREEDRGQLFPASRLT